MAHPREELRRGRRPPRLEEVEELLDASLRLRAGLVVSRRRGVQAECIKLNGALELAPQLGLCQRIVDLVATGRTLKANGLVEVERIADITSRLAVNRAAWKTRPEEIGGWIKKFREAVNGNAD